jgi:hypothetical protein
MNDSSVQSALSERTGLAVCILPNLNVNALSTSTSEFLQVGTIRHGAITMTNSGRDLVSCSPKKAQNLMRLRIIVV